MISKYFELVARDGQKIVLREPISRLGRSSENTIVVSDPAVSRHHLTFYIKDGQLIAEDAGSQNGYLLNGVKGPAVGLLKSGDRIYFGSMEYKVVDPDAPVRPMSSAFATVGNGSFSGATVGMSGLGTNSNYIATPVSVSRPLNPVRIAMIGVFIAMVFVGLSSEEEEGRTPASDSNSTNVFAPIPNEGFKADAYVPKSPTEVQADGRFKEGLRDYWNANYARARIYFETALEINPSHPEARKYLDLAERDLRGQLQKLLEDARRSYEASQFSRARYRAMEILTLLSDDIQGFARVLSVEVNQPRPDKASKTQEETVLELECSKLTQAIQISESAESADKHGVDLKKYCESAKALIKLARQRLGREDVLK